METARTTPTVEPRVRREGPDEADGRTTIHAEEALREPSPVRRGERVSLRHRRVDVEEAPAAGAVGTPAGWKGDVEVDGGRVGRGRVARPSHDDQVFLDRRHRLVERAPGYGDVAMLARDRVAEPVADARFVRRRAGHTHGRRLRPKVFGRLRITLEARRAGALAAEPRLAARHEGRHVDRKV